MRVELLPRLRKCKGPEMEMPAVLAETFQGGKLWRIGLPKLDESPGRKCLGTTSHTTCAAATDGNTKRVLLERLD
eukprot:5999227-Amphidinium_carterae.1